VSNDATGLPAGTGWVQIDADEASALKLPTFLHRQLALKLSDGRTLMIQIKRVGPNPRRAAVVTIGTILGF
jgi:hypothetical protein